MGLADIFTAKPAPVSTEDKYLAQRRARGASSALFGLPDLLNTTLNAGIRDVGSLTGLYDPNQAYQFSMPSQAAANLATELSGATIVPPQAVPPAVQKKGANQEALMGLLPTNPAAPETLALKGLAAIAPVAKTVKPAAPLAETLAAAVKPGSGTVGVKSAEPLAHGRISQRFPIASKKTKDWEGKENPLTENLLINLDVLRADPVKLKQASDVIASYPNTTQEMLEMNPGERVDALRDQATENLLHLYDMMPAAEQARSSRWYHGANRISRERAEEVGAHPYAAAGSYASLSPQKDWFQNVYLGDQVLRVLGDDPKVTTDMLRKAQTMPAYQKDPMTIQMLRSLEGKRLSNMQPEEQALVVRLFEETYGPVGGKGPEDRMFRKISPEGDYGDVVLTKSGAPAKPAWGSFDEIRKAIDSALSGGDPSLISPLMGGKHKVRNFYNNIVAPSEGEQFGDITADTHQIAAGLFRPLSGNTAEVAHGLGSSPPKGTPGAPQSDVTGMQGLYPIFADATRNAAAQRGVPVIAMQSTPWEGVRSLFPADFKTASNMAVIDDIWRQHGRGEITANEARQRIVRAAGGFVPPSW